MKKPLLLLAILLFAGNASAMDFIFDPSPDQRVTGYVVYWSDGTETWNKDIGNENTFTLPDNYFFPGKTYEVWARSNDGTRESADSNHLVIDVPPETTKPAQDKLPVEFYNPLGSPGGVRKL